MANLAPGVDLEARVRDLFAAMDDVQVERIRSFFRDDAVYDVQGFIGPLGMAEFEAYLRSVRRGLPTVRFTISDLAVKRNITFVEWRNEGTLADGSEYRNHGVHVLSWAADGRVVHASVYTEPDKVQAAVGTAE